jgi:hypothetical protein
VSTSLIKLLGRTLVALLLAATGGTVYWQLQPVEWADTHSAGVASLSRTPQLPEIPTATALAELAEQRLRAPLYDPPPAPEPVPEPPKPDPPPRVDLRLVGTIIEKDRSRAVLAAPDGRTEIRGAGEKVTSAPGQVIVADVSADRVVLRVASANDAQVTLTLEGQGGK